MKFEYSEPINSYHDISDLAKFLNMFGVEEVFSWNINYLNFEN